MRTLILTNQAARLLGCTPANVRALARAGKLRAVRVGHVRLFTEEAVHRFAETRRRQAERKHRERRTPSPAVPQDPVIAP